MIDETTLEVQSGRSKHKVLNCLLTRACEWGGAGRARRGPGGLGGGTRDMKDVILQGGSQIGKS